MKLSTLRFSVLGLLALVLLFCLSMFACAPKAQKTFSEKSWKNQVRDTDPGNLYASNKKNGAYYAPWSPMPDKSFFDVIRWKLFYRAEYTEQEKNFLPGVRDDAALQVKQAKGDFILWIGHNTFLIRIKNTFWLTDPIFTQRALLPARVTPPALTAEQINTLCSNLNIIISHNHYDHLDAASIKALYPQAKVFVPMGLKSYVMKMNKPHVTEMDWWQEKSLGGSTRLTCLPAQHWSLRIDQGRNKSLWASWMLETHGITLYLGGDSGYFKGFKEIGKKFNSIDYAFLATTAYHPRWFMHYQHMNIAEAVAAFKDLKARNFIPTQWGTFPLGSEPAGYPGLDLKRFIQKNQLDGDQFHILDIGQLLYIHPAQNLTTEQ